MAIANERCPRSAAMAINQLDHRPLSWRER